MGEQSEVRAVILAGGRGRRLEPYTSVLPKPLMPVGDRAIVEIIVDRLVESGVTDITLCVGYLAHLIEAIFNGRPRGAQLTYVHEDEPLGTAGPLRLVQGLDGTFIVMNGDLLTDLGFRALIASTARLGTRSRSRRTSVDNVVDYGVLHTEPGVSPRLVAYDEKPETALTVSMGIYVIEPAVLDRIPESGYFDFPQLVQRLLDEGVQVGTYPLTVTGSTSGAATTTSARWRTGRRRAAPERHAASSRPNGEVATERVDESSLAVTRAVFAAEAANAFPACTNSRERWLRAMIPVCRRAGSARARAPGPAYRGALLPPHRRDPHANPTARVAHRRLRAVTAPVG